MGSEGEDAPATNRAHEKGTRTHRARGRRAVKGFKLVMPRSRDFSMTPRARVRTCSRPDVLVHFVKIFQKCAIDLVACTEKEWRTVRLRTSLYLQSRMKEICNCWWTSFRDGEPSPRH